LIFGAGSTRGGLEKVSNPPPPVDIDFFDIANQLRGHGTPQLARNVLKSAWELYGKTSGISLEKYYRDIETRAAIGRFAKSANQPKDWDKRQRELEELIRRVYIHTTCDTTERPIKPRESEVHKKILKQLRRGDTVITFNYDLLVEESFDSAKLWTPIDGYGDTARGKTFDWCRRWLEARGFADFTNSKVLLLKLHGSLNWTLYNNRTIRLKPRPYVVRTKSQKPAFDKISVLPPGWNKRIHTNPYKSFWREARLRLEKCKTLLILGYSLPETDLLAHALFAEVVRLRKARKKHLRQIHVADPSETVKDKFVNLFTPALGAYGKVFKYQNIQEIAEKLASP
jgi:hypothetical protein